MERISKENALKELKEFQIDIGSCQDDLNNSPLYYALDEAIKALEQQPCEDCVSREEAIDRMMRKNMPVGEDNTKERFRYLQWLSDLETIKELQSVKPQRSKGRWIEQKDVHKHHYGWFFCSECGAFLMSSDGANYCSCCGAKMEVDG
jgi:hypothetical protein